MLLCTRSLVLCAMLCRSLFVRLFLFWPILSPLRTSLIDLQRRSLIFFICLELIDISIQLKTVVREVASLLFPETQTISRQ